ncbi:MFS transporter [Nonomuraea sp. NPDC050328]|uniref:MFS transporter n=1 Tax=Nonomuraea sp. NPDC050328 TaxID=3364361 RepID=UPI00379FF0BB
MLPQPGPIRALTFALLPRSLGRGLFMTVSVIYFSRSVGLSAAEVGLGLSIAAVVGLSAGLPAGRLCDVVGARTMAFATSVLTGVLLLGYAFVTGFTGFVVVASLVGFAEAAEITSRSTLVGSAVPAEERVSARAYLRVVTNVGWAVGGLAATAALAVDTRPAYLIMVYGAAAGYLLGAVLILRVPKAAPAPRTAERTGPKWAVLRDRPYAVLTLLNAVLFVQHGMLQVAVPLWIDHIGAPVVMVAVINFINTAACILLQVRFSRGSNTIAGAARAQRWAGIYLTGACVLFALAAGASGWLVIGVLALGGVSHVFGELTQSAGSWGLSYELAPDDALGQYQGMYGTGQQLGTVAAPALLSTVLIAWGWPGWLLFGAVFLLAGLAVPPVARWAARTRPEPAVTAAAKL